MYYPLRNIFWIAECLYMDFFKNNLTSRQINRKLRLRESPVELTLSPRVWGSQVPHYLLLKTTNKLLL